MVTDRHNRLAKVLLARAAGMFVSDFFYVKYYKKTYFI